MGLFALVLLDGCTPGLAAKSAGQVGCTPNEITISDEESHIGLIQSGDTWVAECQGHTFVCSQINESGRDKSFFDSLFASEQVTCREAPESLEAERNQRARAIAREERARQPPSRAPTGAAGFEFGETAEEAARSCEAAGHTWNNRRESGKLECSGAAAELGIEAKVDLAFCHGHACSITVEHVPRANWTQSSLSLKGNLESKYGPAQESSGIVPEECRSERALKRCLESGALTLRYIWRWPGSESLEMSVGKPIEGANAAIRLVYRRWAGAANLSAL